MENNNYILADPLTTKVSPEDNIYSNYDDSTNNTENVFVDEASVQDDGIFKFPKDKNSTMEDICKSIKKEWEVPVVNTSSQYNDETDESIDRGKIKIKEELIWLNMGNREHGNEYHSVISSCDSNEEVYNSNNGPIFKCDMCSFSVSSIHQLSSHRLTHFNVTHIENDKAFILDRNESTRNESHIKSEPLIYHSEVLILKCEICPFECNQLQEMKEHKALHENNNVKAVQKVYKCFLCPYISKSLSDNKRHRLTHAIVKCKKGVKSALKSGSRRCKSFKTKRKPKVVGKWYKCDLCPVKYIRLKNLESHKLTHKSDVQTVLIASGENMTESKVIVTEVPIEMNSISLIVSNKIEVKVKSKRRRKRALHTCNVCSLKSTNAKTLVAHYKLKHPGENHLQCDLCTYQCMTKDCMMTHQLVHMTDNPFKCPICDFTCKLENRLKVHESLHSGEKPLKCDSCPFATAEKSRLTRHKKIHLPEKPYKCELCDFRTVQKHKLKVHGVVHTELKQWKCDLCPHATTRSSYLKMHKINKHSPEKERQRKERGEVYFPKCEMNNDDSSSSEIKYFQCQLCPYKTTQRSNFNHHKITHSTEKPFHCEVCEFKCKTKTSLNMHVKVHINDGEFKCSLCPFTSAFQTRLRRHEMNHNPDKPYKCDLCNFSTVQKPKLKTHRTVHFSDKPLKCDLCPFTCKQPYSLKNHKTRHTGVKPFVCDTCAYSTFTKGELKKHMITRHGRHTV